MKSARTQSSFEKGFTTQETFRRNKSYYDASSIAELEQHDAKKRRRPQPSHRYQNQKVNQTFLNSEKER